MNVITLVVQAAVILTLAIIVLSLLAIAGRLLGDLREARIQRLRRRMQQALDEYLAGSIEHDAIVARLARHRRVALDVMIQIAGARTRLRTLFDEFGFVPDEIAALRSRHWSTRVRAATRLSYMGDVSAVPALTHALKDEMLDVRLAAAHALAQLGSVESIRDILRALALPAAWPLQRCAEILYGMGPQAIDPLLALLDEKPGRNDSALCVCVRVLGMLRAEKAAGPVSMHLHSGSLELRLCAAKALGEMGDSRVIPALGLVLEDKAWEVRSAVAQALGRLGDAAAVPSLHQLLDDPAWWVRFNAAESLYRLGGPGERALEHAVNTHRDGFARDIGRQVLERHRAFAVREGLPA